MKWGRCEACNGQVSQPHACPWAWFVFAPDRMAKGECEIVLIAESAEQAAAIWAEKDDEDSGEYSIAGGDPITVRVQRVTNDHATQSPRPPVWLAINGGYSPTYEATQIEDPTQ